MQNIQLVVFVICCYIKLKGAANYSFANKDSPYTPIKFTIPPVIWDKALGLSFDNNTSSTSKVKTTTSKVLVTTTVKTLYQVTKRHKAAASPETGRDASSEKDESSEKDSSEEYKDSASYEAYKDSIADKTSNGRKTTLKNNIKGDEDKKVEETEKDNTLDKNEKEDEDKSSDEDEKDKSDEDNKSHDRRKRNHNSGLNRYNYIQKYDDEKEPGLDKVTLKNKTHWEGVLFRKPCECSENNNCVCCAKAFMDEYKISLCCFVSYIEPKKQFDLTLTLINNEDHALVSNNSKAKPLCIKPTEPPIVEFCAEISTNNIAGRFTVPCLDIDANIEGFPVVVASFRCFESLAKKETSKLKEIDVPAQQTLPTEPSTPKTPSKKKPTPKKTKRHLSYSNSLKDRVISERQVMSVDSHRTDYRSIH